MKRQVEFLARGFEIGDVKTAIEVEEMAIATY